MKFNKEEKEVLTNITKYMKEQIDYKLIHEEYDYNEIDSMLHLSMILDLLIDKLYKW